MRLDEKGRCCGRKPLRYTGKGWRSKGMVPQLFCCRCDRTYTLAPPHEQIPNWAYEQDSQNRWWRLGYKRIGDSLDLEITRTLVEETPAVTTQSARD